MPANAVESLTGDDDQDGDIGLNAVQAAIAEDAARAAIRVVLAQTRGIAVPAPALEVAPRGNLLADLEVPRRRLRSVHQAPRNSPDLPDIIAYPQAFLLELACGVWALDRRGSGR
jgi:hypothetical protein